VDGLNWGTRDRGRWERTQRTPPPLSPQKSLLMPLSCSSDAVAEMVITPSLFSNWNERRFLVLSMISYRVRIEAVFDSLGPILKLSFSGVMANI
jgi:hypothetical protein